MIFLATNKRRSTVLVLQHFDLTKMTEDDVFKRVADVPEEIWRAPLWGNPPDECLTIELRRLLHSLWEAGEIPLQCSKF